MLASGADMLWYPVGYTAGYLVLLVLVAAPLRRSGAYTLPDFAEARLGSRSGARGLRRCSSSVIGWLYLLPQFQGAGLRCTPSPARRPGSARGRRGGRPRQRRRRRHALASRFVQAFQYWLKLTALLVPAVVLLAVAGRRRPPPARADLDRRGDCGRSPLGRRWPRAPALRHVLASCSRRSSAPWACRTSSSASTPTPTAAPPVARRSSVLGLLGVFYLFPPVYGALGRVYAAELVADGRADTVVLVLPRPMFDGPARRRCSPALVAAGAFAAFLSTVLGLRRGRRRDRAGRARRRLGAPAVPGVAAFRVAAVLAVVVPFVLRSAAGDVGVADTVGLAFAVAASTFCPLLRARHLVARAHRRGAMAGLSSAAAPGAWPPCCDRPRRRRRRRLGRRAARRSRPPGRCRSRSPSMVVVAARPAAACPRDTAAVHGPAAHPRGPRPRTVGASTRDRSAHAAPPSGDASRPLGPADRPARGPSLAPGARSDVAPLPHGSARGAVPHPP